MGFGRIHKVRVSKLPYEGRDLGAHAMLYPERLVGIPLQDQSFEQTSIQIIAFALFNCKQIIVHFGAQLPMGGNTRVGMQFSKRGQ